MNSHLFRSAPLLLVVMGCSGPGQNTTADAARGDRFFRRAPAQEVDVLLHSADSVLLHQPLDHPIGYIASAALVDGALYVADLMMNEVRSYGSDGRLIAVVGRSGRGPGEYTLPTWVGPGTGGNLLVVDGEEGKLIEYGLPDHAYRREWRTGRRDLMAVRPMEGHLVATGHLEPTSDGGAALGAILDSLGNPLEHLFRLTRERRDTPGVRSVATGWVSQPAGVVIGASTEATLYRLNSSGTISDSMVLPENVFLPTDFPPSSGQDFRVLVAGLRLITGVVSLQGNRVALGILEPQPEGALPNRHRIALLSWDTGASTVMREPCACRVLTAVGDTLIGITGEYTDSTFLHRWVLLGGAPVAARK